MKLMQSSLLVLLSVCTSHGMFFSDLPENETVQLARMLHEKNDRAFSSVQRGITNDSHRNQAIVGAVVLVAARCPEILSESMRMVSRITPESFLHVPMYFLRHRTESQTPAYLSEVLADSTKLHNFLSNYLHTQLRNRALQHGPHTDYELSLSNRDILLCSHLSRLRNGTQGHFDFFSSFTAAASTIPGRSDALRVKLLKCYIQNYVKSSELPVFSEAHRAAFTLYAQHEDLGFIDCDTDLFNAFLHQSMTQADAAAMCAGLDMDRLVNKIKTFSIPERHNFFTLFAYCCTTPTADGQYPLVKLYEKYVAFAKSSPEADEVITSFFKVFFEKIITKCCNHDNALVFFKQCMDIFALGAESERDNHMIAQTTVSFEYFVQEIFSTFIARRPESVSDVARIIAATPHKHRHLFFSLGNNCHDFLIITKALLSVEGFDLPALRLKEAPAVLDRIPQPVYDHTAQTMRVLTQEDRQHLLILFDYIFEKGKVLCDEKRCTSLDQRFLSFAVCHSMGFIGDSLQDLIHHGTAPEAAPYLRLINKISHVFLRQNTSSTQYFPIYYDTASILVTFVERFGFPQSIACFDELGNVLTLALSLYLRDLSNHQLMHEDLKVDYQGIEVEFPLMVNRLVRLIHQHADPLPLIKNLSLKLIRAVTTRDGDIERFLAFLDAGGDDSRLHALILFYCPCFDHSHNIFGVPSYIISNVQAVAHALEIKKTAVALERAHGIVHMVLADRLVPFEKKIEILRALKPSFARDVINYPACAHFILATLDTDEQIRLLPHLLHAGLKLDGYNSKGKTALMEYAIQGNTVMFEAFVRAGADVRLTDLFDFTVVDYIVNSQHARPVKASMLALVHSIYPFLLNRASTGSRTTPLMNYMMNIMAGGARPTQESMIDTVELLVHYGASLTIQNVEGANALDIAYDAARFGVDLQCIGDRLCAVLYEGPEHQADQYLRRHEALAIATTRCAGIEDRTVIDRLRERFDQLYNRSYTRVKNSVVQQEIALLLEQASEAVAHVADSQRIVDVNGNGFYLTYDSYRQLCLQGSLNAVLREDIDQHAVREIPSLASYILALLERRTSRVHHELTFSDYPRVDVVTFSGFIITLESLMELLAVTEQSYIADAIRRAYSSEEELERLCQRCEIDVDEMQESLELFRLSKVNLMTVHDLVDFLSRPQAKRVCRYHE